MMRTSMWMTVLFVSVSLTGGCDDDCETVCEPVESNGPIVLHVGPDDPAETVAVWGRPEENSIYVQFGDPQGFEDLSTAILEIEDVRVMGAVGRDYLGADDLGGFCNDTGAVYDEDLPFDVFAMLPSSLGGLPRQVVDHDEGLVDLSTLLCYSEWCPYSFLTAELLTTASAEFGPSVEGGCTTAMALIGVYPPLRDPVSDIIITRLELDFVNVSVTIFDAGGDSIRATWPALRVNYTHPDEMP